MNILKTLECWWRHNIVYPLLRIYFKNSEVRLPIDLQSIRSILILRYDRIGDMIVTTPIFKILKDANPKLKIGVLASRKNADIIRYNPSIDNIFLVRSHWWQTVTEIYKARKENYDVILNFIFNRTTSGGVISNFIAPNGIKIGQGDDKYGFYFNILLKLTRQSSHMVQTLASIIKAVFDLEINPDELKYDIELDEQSKEFVENYLIRHKLSSRNEEGNSGIPYIIFNMSANDSVRRISTEQAFSIGIFLGSKKSIRTLLVVAPDDEIMKNIRIKLIEETDCMAFPDQGNASLLELAAIIKNARAVISPDTSIIHFASAGQTPILGFYTSMQDAHEWLPLHVKHKIMLSEINQPTSSIPVDEMIQGIDRFLETL